MAGARDYPLRRSGFARRPMALCLVFLVLKVAVSVGCGSGNGLTIEGTVAVDGVPLETGTISFTPVSTGAGEAVSAPIVGGKYKVRNVAPGQTRVQFHAPRQTGKMITSTDPAEGGTYPEVINLIPTSFRDGIEITLAKSDKVQNFDLASR